MRILALTNLYPRPGHEAFAPFNRQQFRALAEAHDLAVVAPVPWPEVARRWWTRTELPQGALNPDGIRVWHPTYYFPPRFHDHRYGHYYLASVRRCVTNLIGTLRPDVLLACWAHPDGWAAVALGREAGLPVVIKVVGSDLRVASRGARRAARIREALRGADAVVAVGQDLARCARSLGAAPARVCVVPEGLDRALFAPGDQAAARMRLGLPADGRIILFVGNLLFSKGAGLLVEACGLLAARSIDAHCYFVGQGRDHAKIRGLIARRGLAHRITLAGARPHAHLGDWYRAADLVALPSDSEGIPNVLREAAACARPYVATRVGGIPEIADPRTTRLVPPGDAAALADALAELLAHPPALGAFDDRATSCSWAESAARLADVLRGAVASHAMPRGAGTRAAGACVRDPRPVPALVRPARAAEAPFEGRAGTLRTAVTSAGPPPPPPPRPARGTASARVFRGRDLLCFSHDWSGDPLSKTHLMRLLARDNRVLWVNSIGYRAPTASRADCARALCKLRAAARPVRAVEPNLFVLSPLTIPAYGCAAIRTLNRHLLRLQVRRAMRRLGFRRPINWVFNPAAALVAGTLGEEALIYYCVDEYTAFSGVPSAALAALEADLLAKADLVVVSAERLLRAKGGAHPHTVLVRHGVDFDHFRRALDPHTAVPAEIARLPRPVIGYFGLLAEDWVDTQLLARVADHFAGGSLVLLGKATMDLRALGRHPNVHWLGRKPYAALPAYCKGFDVALVPFPISEVTLSANPLKAREYLAAGLPVVSTAIPEVAVLGSCRIGVDHADFVRQIEQALADPGPSRARSEAVRHESWSARLEELRDHVAALGHPGFSGAYAGSLRS